MGSTDKVWRIFINFTTAENLMQSFITLSGLYTDSIHAKWKSGEKNLQAGNQIREPVSIKLFAAFIALNVFTFHSARALNLKAFVSF